MAPIKSVKDYFEKVVVPTMRTLFMAMFGPSPENPELPPATEPAKDGHPYRGTEPPKVPEPTAVEPPAVETEFVVTCETKGEEGRDKAVVEAIKVRTKRRAIRYFKGLNRPERKEVKHRVTDRKPDEIEFSYFRRSGKPMRIRWRKEPHAEIQDQK